MSLAKVSAIAERWRTTDLTYVTAWRGFVCMAFAIHAFVRRIVAWRASNSTVAKPTPLSPLRLPATKPVGVG